MTANFIVTRNCNGNCAFCGVHHQSRDFSREVPVEQLMAIVDRLYEADVLRINYFGGEPTVYPALTQVMAYSKKLKFYNSIVTNGLHLPPGLTEHPEVVDALAISLHGPMEAHCRLAQVSEAGYRRTLEHLGVYAGLGIPLTVNMTVTPENYETIPAFTDDLLERFPIGAFAFNRYIPSPSVMRSDKRKFVMSARQLNESLEKIDAAATAHPEVQFRYAIHFPYCAVREERLIQYVGNCGFGQNYISVDCDGNLQACSYSDRVLGNILQEDLGTLWREHETLRQYRSQEWLPEKCRRCRYVMRCASGCKLTGDEAVSPDYLLKELEE